MAPDGGFSLGPENALGLFILDISRSHRFGLFQTRIFRRFAPNVPRQEAKSESNP
jgi:hypothetical protein